MDTPPPAQEPRAQVDSRFIRFVAFGLLALVINGFWMRFEVGEVVAELSYSDCWGILIWDLVGTLPAFAVGFALALLPGLRGRVGGLALLVLGLCIAAAWQQWNLLVPGLLLGALAGTVDAKLGPLFRRLLLGCAAVYVLNAACVAVGLCCAYGAMQEGEAGEPLLVGTDEKNLSKEHWEEWRGCPVEAPIPFFLPQDALLLQVDGGNIGLWYGGQRQSSPELAAKDAPWVRAMQQGRYYQLF